jgi:hypothetical protein
VLSQFLITKSLKIPYRCTDPPSSPSAREVLHIDPTWGEAATMFQETDSGEAANVSQHTVSYKGSQYVIRDRLPGKQPTCPRRMVPREAATVSQETGSQGGMAQETGLQGGSPRVPGDWFRDRQPPCHRRPRPGCSQHVVSWRLGDTKPAVASKRLHRGTRCRPYQFDHPNSEDELAHAIGVPLLLKLRRSPDRQVRPSPPANAFGQMLKPPH